MQLCFSRREILVLVSKIEKVTLPTGRAPPCTRFNKPASARSLRSRRIVSSETLRSFTSSWERTRPLLVESLQYAIFPFVIKHLYLNGCQCGFLHVLSGVCWFLPVSAVIIGGLMFQIQASGKISGKKAPHNRNGFKKTTQEVKSQYIG